MSAYIKSKAEIVVTALLLSVLAGCSTVMPRTDHTASTPIATAPMPSTAADSADTGRQVTSTSATDASADGPSYGLNNTANNQSNEGELGIAHLGDEIALRAIALVGKPYRYGGADLDGFDCSGLVYFIYHQLGREVPRTAQQQQQAATRVARKHLVPGDLVFFKIKRSKVVSHVGVYVGDDRFVHAPQSGKTIELRNLDDHYFAKRWVSAGRFD